VKILEQKMMAGKGAKVVVNYASSITDANKVVNEITENGGRAIAIQGEVSNSEDVKRLLRQPKKRLDS
jgi:3-oxoacyl-[acyl-carrier protein] reductase